MTPRNDSPVEYPTVRAGGAEYQLRFAHAAWFQLQSWGFETGPDKSIPILALAAAACGKVGADGKWRTKGFSSALEFADSLLPEETPDSFSRPVLEALEKAKRAAEITVVAAPAKDQTTGQAA